MAREQVDAETLNYEETDIRDALQELMGARGPGACTDAVGMEGHHYEANGASDRVAHAACMEAGGPQEDCVKLVLRP